MAIPPRIENLERHGGLTSASDVSHGVEIFHPIGRVTLATRHGGTPSDDDVIAPVRLRPLLAASGWHAESIDDGAEHYLALAVRV